MNIRAELNRIKSVLAAPRPDEFEPTMIRVRGGVAGTPLHATVGHMRVIAHPTEDEDTFIARCFDLAAEQHAQLIVLGGLLLGEH